MKVQSCEFVSATDLIPRSWDSWFWERFSTNAPFTWGDNNRSMVTASAFADHMQQRFDDSPRIKRVLKKIRALGEMYVDLES